MILLMDVVVVVGGNFCFGDVEIGDCDGGSE